MEKGMEKGMGWDGMGDFGVRDFGVRDVRKGKRKGRENEKGKGKKEGRGGGRYTIYLFCGLRFSNLSCLCV